MKQVINGKTYNTDTATEIANYDNGLGGSDFRHCDESLYVTKKGNYFIAGVGGPLSRWAQPCGNMTSGGSGIIAYSNSEALDWCESHDVDADVICKYFNIEDA